MIFVVIIEMQCLEQTSLLGLTSASEVEQISQLEAALQKAIEDIALLQGHLSYLIKYKDELEGEIEART